MSNYYPIWPTWYGWPSPQLQHHPMLPWYNPQPMYPAMIPNYQSMFYQYPHQYYQQQGQRGPGLGTDIAGVLGFGALRWLALRSLMGY